MTVINICVLYSLAKIHDIMLHNVENNFFGIALFFSTLKKIELIETKLYYRYLYTIIG